MSEQAARNQLDWALFCNVHNMHYDDDKYEITYEGDNYVVWDKKANELFHFRVVIEPHKWDSTQARKDQEWDV